MILIPEEEDEDAEHEEDDGSDDEGWITPSNFKSKKLEMLGVDSQIEEEEKEIIVACLTSDFAMQNVLKQMGKCFEKMEMNTVDWYYLISMNYSPKHFIHTYSNSLCIGHEIESDREFE